MVMCCERESITADDWFSNGLMVVGQTVGSVMDRWKWDKYEIIKLNIQYDDYRYY